MGKMADLINSFEQRSVMFQPALYSKSPTCFLFFFCFSTNIMNWWRELTVGVKLNRINSRPQDQISYDMQLISLCVLIVLPLQIVQDKLPVF